MYGLEAIEAANGWSISIIGVTIVFAGLLGLCLLISQFPKIFKVLEKKDAASDLPQSKAPEIPLLKVKASIGEAIRNFSFLTKWMGEPFSLPKLLNLAEKRGMVQPYSTMNHLLVEGIILPDEKGYFVWNENIKIIPKGN